MNGDGKLDVVVLDCAPTGSTDCPATGNMTVAVRLGRGDGTFGPIQSFGTGGLGSINPTPVAVADVNGDGKPDLLVGNFCLEVNGTASAMARSECCSARATARLHPRLHTTPAVMAPK